jgi:hypothetical protein
MIYVIVMNGDTFRVFENGSLSKTARVFENGRV